MKHSLAILSLTTLLSACSLVPDYMRPDMSMSDDWRGAAASVDESAKVDEQWWVRFDSQELDGLVAAALEENTELRAALARIEQSRASLMVAGAPLLPQANATGAASQSDTSRSASNESYRATLGLSYEVDLFGRNRARRDAAQADLEATQFDREALKLVVAGDVSTAYFQLLTLKERVAIAERNLTRAEDVYKVIEAQYSEGRLSGLEMAQQRVELASARAQLSSIRNQQATTRNALAVLLGRNPQAFDITATSLEDVVAPNVALALPANLIEQRPDIRASEAALVAANADIGAARAALYPQLSLGLDATAFANPSYTATSLAASLVAPIFRGGELRGGVKLAEARKVELVENYRQAVLVAFQEVEDALAGLKAAGERQAFLLEAAQEADRAYTIAQEQFKAGAIDFQALLLAQSAQLNASDSFLQSKLELLSASVDLLQALGGGWQED